MSIYEKIYLVILLILFIFLNIASINSTSSFLRVKDKHFNSLAELDLNSKEIYTDSVIEAFCFLNSNGTVYDINPLYNEKEDYTMKDKNYTMHFNFCNPPKTQCSSKNTSALAVITDEKNNCYSLGGSKNTLSKWSVISNLDFFNFIIFFDSNKKFNKSIYFIINL